MQRGLPCRFQCKLFQRLVRSSGFGFRAAVLRNVGEIEILKQQHMGRNYSKQCAAFLTVTNRDKSAVWALLGEVGYVPHRSFRATRGETGHQFFSLLIASISNLTVKEKPRQNASCSPRFMIWIFTTIYSRCFMMLCLHTCFLHFAPFFQRPGLIVFTIWSKRHYVFFLTGQQTSVTNSSGFCVSCGLT